MTNKKKSLKSILEEQNLLNDITIPESERLPYEIFLEITNDAVKDIEIGRYYISNYSRVYDTILQRLLKITRPKSKDYYPQFTTKLVTGKFRSVLLHRVLMLVFYPEHDPKYDIVNHKDGNKCASFLPNLEFTDTKGNAIHARDTGLLNPVHGEEHCCAKITEVECREICKMLESQIYSMVEIANIFNISESIVNSIKIGKAWKHISKDYNIPKDRRIKYSKYFTNGELYKLCEYFQSNPKDDEEKLMVYVRRALSDNNLKENTGRLDGCRKLYRKQKWKYVWCQFNY
nr:MAG TPA: PROTEIN/DNA Complex catalytic motif, Helix-turn-helix DNA [Caudoviricetes sp.]